MARSSFLLIFGLAAICLISGVLCRPRGNNRGQGQSGQGHRGTTGLGPHSQHKALCKLFNVTAIDVVWTSDCGSPDLECIAQPPSLENSRHARGRRPGHDDEDNDGFADELVPYFCMPLSCSVDAPCAESDCTDEGSCDIDPRTDLYKYVTACEVNGETRRQCADLEQCVVQEIRPFIINDDLVETLGFCTPLPPFQLGQGRPASPSGGRGQGQGHGQGHGHGQGRFSAESDNSSDESSSSSEESPESHESDETEASTTTTAAAASTTTTLAETEAPTTVAAATTTTVATDAPASTATDDVNSLD